MGAWVVVGSLWLLFLVAFVGAGRARSADRRILLILGGLVLFVPAYLFTEATVAAELFHFRRWDDWNGSIPLSLAGLSVTSAVWALLYLRGRARRIGLLCSTGLALLSGLAAAIYQLTGSWLLGSN